MSNSSDPDIQQAIDAAIARENAEWEARKSRQPFGQADINVNGTRALVSYPRQGQGMPITLRKEEKNICYGGAPGYQIFFCLPATEDPQMS